MNESERIRKSIFWLATSTVLMFLVLVVIGIYVYKYSKQADQIHDNTNRLNIQAAATCEVAVAPDSKETFVIHQIATGQLVITHHDCIVILNKLENKNPEP